MHIKITDLLSRSIHHTRATLFEPFQLKKWGKLLLIGYCAGALSFGSVGGDFSQPKKDDAFHSRENVASAVQEESDEGARLDQATDAPLSATEAADMQNRGGVDGVSPFILMVLFCAFLCIGLPLYLFFMWLNARFTFIWLQGAMQNDTRIKALFCDYKKEGASLYRFNCIVFFVIFLSLVLLGFWFYTEGTRRGVFESGYVWTFQSGFELLILPVSLFLFEIALSGVIHFVMNCFIVPTMWTERISVKEGFKTIAPFLSADMFQILKYACITIGLKIAAFIVTGVLSFGIFLFVGILAAILVGVPYLLFSVLLKVHSLFIIVAVVFGIPLVLLLCLMLASANLPCALFLRAFSVFFITELRARGKKTDDKAHNQGESFLSL
jgi:hypothetical protein